MFVYRPAADTSEDPQYDLAGTRIAIQDCRSYGGGWTVTELAADGAAMTFHGEFTSLAKAKAKAFAITLQRATA